MTGTHDRHFLDGILFIFYTTKEAFFPNGRPYFFERNSEELDRSHQSPVIGAHAKPGNGSLLGQYDRLFDHAKADGMPTAGLVDERFESPDIDTFVEHRQHVRAQPASIPGDEGNGASLPRVDTHEDKPVFHHDPFPVRSG